jgi:hypothetical protein
VYVCMGADVRELACVCVSRMCVCTKTCVMHFASREACSWVRVCEACTRSHMLMFFEANSNSKAFWLANS